MTAKTPHGTLTDFCAQHVPRHDAEGTAGRILAALSAAGFVIVPREPDEYMRECGAACINDMAYFESDTDSAFALSIVRAVYDAMLAAAEEKPDAA